MWDGPKGKCYNDTCPCHSTTPDTEWEAQTFRENLERVCKYAETNYCPGCGLTPEGLDQLISSRDTYWEEQLQKAREEMPAGIQEVLDEIKSKATYGAYGVHHILFSDLAAIAARYHSELNQDISK